MILQGRPVRRRTAAQGEIGGNASQVLFIVEIGPFQPDGVPVGQAGGVAVQGDVAQATLVELDPGAVPEHLVGGQAAGEAQLVVDPGFHVQAELVGQDDVVGGVVCFGGRNHARLGHVADGLLDLGQGGIVESHGIIDEEGTHQRTGRHLDVLVLERVGPCAQLHAKGHLVRGGVQLCLVEPIVDFLDLFFLGGVFTFQIFELLLDFLSSPRFICSSRCLSSSRGVILR
jgi:hypothetical protein